MFATLPAIDDSRDDGNRRSQVQRSRGELHQALPVLRNGHASARSGKDRQLAVPPVHRQIGRCRSEKRTERLPTVAIDRDGQYAPALHRRKPQATSRARSRNCWSVGPCREEKTGRARARVRIRSERTHAWHCHLLSAISTAGSTRQCFFIGPSCPCAHGQNNKNGVQNDRHYYSGPQRGLLHRGVR
ncbi:hypothetical protein P3T21_007240 [Paraburkholderia sp. GAS334]